MVPAVRQFPGPPGAYPDTDDVSTSYCKLATDLGTAGGVAVDAQGRIYVGPVVRTADRPLLAAVPDRPDAAGGCGGTDATGAPLADAVQREVFATAGRRACSPSPGLAIAPNGNLYAAERVHRPHRRVRPRRPSRAAHPRAADATLADRRPATPRASPSGADGTLYYADLDLLGTLPDVGPGPNGKVWRIRFDADGDPQPPEIVREGLAFPDGVALFPGNPSEEPPAPARVADARRRPDAPVLQPRRDAR